MKNIIKLEEAALFGLSIFLFSQTAYSWWVYPALLLTPDMSMIGYAFGNKVGAFLYNLFHHQGLAIAILIVGWSIQGDPLALAGMILLGHAAMDRVFGYGLKYTTGFHHTHLGQIGQK